MCGIAGFWPTRPPPDVEAAIRGMAGALRHRGPDHQGFWLDRENGLALGHRRLSILDLSPEGDQPMESHSGRFVIVFNGEVYNYRELLDELRQSGAMIPLRGHSDTEGMLAAIEHWGLHEAVDRFVGMFAFALWDRRERDLYLVRDRLGIKPLYYGWVDGAFVFGSELRAVRAYPGFRAEVDRGAVSLLLRHNCIPAPYSIYRGIHQLLPGHSLVVRSPAPHAGVPVPYWSAARVAEQGSARPFLGTDDDAVGELDRLLREAVRLRMIADVPLGAFLSGGVDSSVVVALMQAQSDRPVRTFSIGSHDRGFDEARHAKAVARHLGTDHTELYVSPDDALSLVPRLPELFDEPFADSSQIPTYLVCELARQQVSVSLSGDGGDELFAGYNRHLWGGRVWSWMSRVPVSVRRAGSRALGGVAPRTWDDLLRRASPLLPSALNHRMPGYKLQKLAGLLSAESPEELYRRLASHWTDPASLVLGATEPQTALTDVSRRSGLRDLTTRMMYLDLITYLPDDILTKVDRASMAVSLEARVPLLDHRVVEFAWTLPLSMKIRNGRSKWVLREVLHRYVPRKLIERPKMGFGIPLHSWLRGPLREWAEDLLDERRLRQEGFFDPGPVRRRWAEHLSGKQDWQYHLWDVLMFQAWLKAQPQLGAPDDTPASVDTRAGAGAG